MVKITQKGKEFYGTTTIGKKGQLVIPAEARAAMNLKKGEKLLVFGMGCDMVTLAKLSNLEKFASRLADRLQAIRQIINRSESK